MNSNNSKYLIVVIFMVIVIWACKDGSQTQALVEKESVQMELSSLFGKTIEYRYGDDVYHVILDDESNMHWRAVAGGEEGVHEKENYRSEFIDDMKLFITWGEANGIGVSQILDFENKVVHNHLLRGRDISIGKGEISILSH